MEGIYERFERAHVLVDANVHHIRFDATSLEKVELKKMRPETWTIMPEPLPLMVDTVGDWRSRFPIFSSSPPPLPRRPTK